MSGVGLETSQNRTTGRPSIFAASSPDAQEGKPGEGWRTPFGLSPRVRLAAIGRETSESSSSLVILLQVQIRSQVVFFEFRNWSEKTRGSGGITTDFVFYINATTPEPTKNAASLPSVTR